MPGMNCRAAAGVDQAGDAFVPRLPRRHGLFEGGRRLGVVEAQVAGRRSRELDEMRSGAHRLADVDGELTHVGPLGAGDATAHRLSLGVELEDVDGVDLHLL